MIASRKWQQHWYDSFILTLSKALKRRDVGPSGRTPFSLLRPPCIPNPSDARDLKSALTESKLHRVNFVTYTGWICQFLHLVA